MNDDHVSVSWPGLKIFSAWVAAGFANVGINSWGEAAQAAATLYTIMLIVEVIWNKWTRPCMERRKWIKPKDRAKGKC